MLKRDPDAYQRRLLQRSFNAFDADRSGTLEPAEVQAAMAKMGVELSMEDVSEMFAEVLYDA